MLHNLSSNPFLQGMSPLQLFSLLSSIRPLCTLWKGNIDTTSWSSSLSILHYLHCSASDLNFVKNCWIVSKLLDCNDISLFSNTCPQISSCFPNKNSSFSQDSWGVFNPSRWKRRSLEMWVQRNPNASSNWFKNLFFLVWWQVYVSLPIVILNRPSLCNETCIYSLQST